MPAVVRASNERSDETGSGRTDFALMADVGKT
jgi:hypothetical protein